MSIYETMKHAVLAKKPVVIVREGVEQFVCPHVIGTKYNKKTGELYESTLVYQYGGPSDRGLGPDGSDQNWRCIPLHQIDSVRIVEGKWHTVSQLPTSRSTCVDNIDAQV